MSPDETPLLWQSIAKSKQLKKVLQAGEIRQWSRQERQRHKNQSQ